MICSFFVQNTILIKRLKPFNFSWAIQYSANLLNLKNSRNVPERTRLKQDSSVLSET